MSEMISGPLRPAANMKPKCSMSWLPRVKLPRSRFMAASLVGRFSDTGGAAAGSESGMHPLAQGVVAVAREEGIDAQPWRRATGGIAGA
jgi:hypothetical protein